MKFLEMVIMQMSSDPFPQLNISAIQFSFRAPKPTSSLQEKKPKKQTNQQTRKQLNDLK